MKTLFDMTLNIARKVTHVENGVATAGDARSLSDALGEFGVGSFANGTLWILSGTHAGKSRRIKTNPKDKFTFETLGSVPCVQQVETATVIAPGGITGSGNATVIVTAAGMTNSPKTVNVAVLNADSASAVATKIKNALNADVDVSDFFTASSNNADVILTAKVAAANDATMNAGIANGSCSGLTAAPTSTNTTAGVAGPRYAVCDKEFTRAMLRAAVNEALRVQAPYDAEDVSLVTVAGQDEYTLPAGVSQVKKVEVATETAAPYGYYVHCHWDEVSGKLRFPSFAPQLDDYKIRLTYTAGHTDLSDDASAIPFGVNEDALYWKAIIALLSDAKVLRPKEPRYVDIMNEAQEMYRRTNPNQKRTQRTPRLADW